MEERPPSQTPPAETPNPEPPAVQVVISPGESSNKKLWIVIVALVVLLIGGAAAWWFLGRGGDGMANKTSNTNNDTNGNNQAQQPTVADGLKLDMAKNYGDKYSSGLLPVGDEMYVTDGAKKGYIYMCNANFVPSSQAGAQTRGPWFTSNNTKWDINKKVAVKGKVSWDQNITVKIENGKRVVTTNNLPDHHTGTFPVASGDPAYTYDRNPNTIKSQTFIYSLAASPAYGSPQCMGGEVGVMLGGVAIFNGFDAGGRDAGAWEVQDSCDGHPQSAGAYHYHTLSRCITDVSVKTVIGYALDGFPITGPKVGDKNILTTSDLDECHGIISEIALDGKKVTTYHYVMTQDFPYSVSCFRATAIKPPGQSETAGGGSQQPTGQQQPPPPSGGTLPPKP